MASRTAREWPVVLSGIIRRGASPLAGGGLGETDRVAGGEHDVRVVEEPVDGRVGDGFGHEFIEPGGMQVRRQGDRWSFVGGVDDAVEGLGGLGRDG